MDEKRLVLTKPVAAMMNVRTRDGRCKVLLIFSSCQSRQHGNPKHRTTFKNILKYCLASIQHSRPYTQLLALCQQKTDIFPTTTVRQH